MKNWKVWVLKDVDGNVIIKGRKREVMQKAYERYVYMHIFTDMVVKTNKALGL